MAEAFGRVDRFAAKGQCGLFAVGRRKLLKLERLKVHGLEPVSLEIQSGECVAVQGPSGSGKTVLLRAIADLDPANGHVSLDGTERNAISGPEWRSLIRYAAAEPGWWGDTPGAHFQDREKAAGLAGALGLETAMFDMPLSRLSTGERQRLALVRAVETSPDVLLLDEPTGALDAESTKRVETLLRQQLEDGKAIILVSHDPKQVTRLAGRCADIRDGRLEVTRT